jgi:hypothetical protein
MAATTIRIPFFEIYKEVKTVKSDHLNVLGVSILPMFVRFVFIGFRTMWYILFF